LYILIFVFIAACTAKNEQATTVEQKKDSIISSADTVVEINTVIPVEQTIVLNAIPLSKELNDRLRYFKEKYLVNYAEHTSEELKVHVLDRFTSEKKYKLNLLKRIPVKYGKVENVFPIMNIRAYTFSDSAQCANAVNNWLNCFGNDCNTIKVGENTMIKSTPGFYIINPTSIISLDYQVEHSENNWSEIISHLKKLFATKESILIYVKSQGKLSWEMKQR
jgi:hypothetical protein